MKKPTILYVHHGKGIGGAPLSLLYTIQGVRNEYNTEVLFIHGGEIVQRYKKQGIKTYVDESMVDLSHTEVSSYSLLNPVFWLRLFLQPITFFKFYNFVKKINPNIVHLNTSSLITFALAAKTAGKKVVLHVREPLASGSIGLRKAILRELIYRFADAVIPISQHDASKLKPSRKITVVHNFVDFGYFDKNKKCSEYAKLKAKRKMILHLGGISPLKGTHTLIESLKYVEEKTSDFICVIAGTDKDRTGFYKWRLRREIEANKLGDKVKFLSPVLDVPELIACADVVVFPSTKPHFARPIIEASAMAKPVIASDLGGPRELVINGKTGFLVPPNDPKKLGEAIAKVLTKSKLAAQMGANGYAFALKKFEQGKNVACIKQVYHTLLTRRV